MTFSSAALALCVALPCVVLSVRMKRQSSAMEHLAQRAGVKLLNFRDDAEEWTVLFRHGATAADKAKACGGACEFVGESTPFALVRGMQKVTQLLTREQPAIELMEPDVIDFMIPHVDVEDIDGMRASASKLASWGLEPIGVEKRGSTGKGVHIYVHDTGVRSTHMDFGGRAIPFIDMSGNSMTSADVFLCEGDRKCATDMAGHGTHCAGTAGGRTFGVASDAKIYVVKVLGDSGSGQRVWNFEAMDHVVTHGQKPAVISLSLGGAGADPLYDEVVRTSVEGGVTVVVAAGNFGSDACTYSPAFSPFAITVGATDPDKSRAGYSNHGACNDIMAPGTAIVSASDQMDFAEKRLTGTSMACPAVAGAAALLLETNPTWHRDQIFDHLQRYGKVDYMTDLKPGDPNLFLWVGQDLPVSEDCPAFAVYTEPSYWGDCQCKAGKFCSTNGGMSRNCPTSMGVGEWSGKQFSQTCLDCRCFDE